MDDRRRQIAAREREIDDRERRVREREQSLDAREHSLADGDDPSDVTVPDVATDVADEADPTTRSLPLTVGQTLDGRWRVEGFAAQGGAGTIWWATDLLLQRSVAIKVMHSHLLRDEASIERFEREARLLAQVEHEHVMRLFDVLRTDGHAAMVSEYVRGPSLHDVIELHAPLRAPVVAAIGLQLADGLAAIHQRGIVHRDLKPRNVLFTPSGSLKIVDFGTATQLSADLTLTPEGVTVGSPAYLAPEQVQGYSGDRRTDIYAAGLVLWETIAGRRPFTGDTPAATALARLAKQVPRLTEIDRAVSPHLSDIVERATRQDPAERFQTARELASALRPFIDGRPVELTRSLMST